MAQEPNFKFLPQGALIQEFTVAGQNIVLNFPTPEPYRDAPFFGETVGRVANRISGASFHLDSHTYRLAANDGANHAHGGRVGWGKKSFRGPQLEERAGREALKFTYISPHEDEGYPGTVEVRVWYTTFSEVHGNISRTELEAEYEVELIGDECDATIVNLTNHSYFNLTGDATIENTECTLSTIKCLDVDKTLLPTGEIRNHPTMQQNTAVVLTVKEPVLDNCFVVETDPAKVSLDTRSKNPQLIASLFHPVSKIHLDVFTTEPAFQVYTGDYLDVPAQDKSPGYGPRAGICIEPGRYINAINHPKWRHMVVLKRGQLWGAKTVYKARKG